MILNTGFNNKFNNNFNFNNNNDSIIKSLEKAQGILDERLSRKQISNEEYIRKSNEIKKDIEKYKNSSNS